MFPKAARRREGFALSELSARLCALLSRAEAALWGPGMMALLLGAGVFLSIRAGFPQLRRFGEMQRALFGSDGGIFARHDVDPGIGAVSRVNHDRPGGEVNQLISRPQGPQLCRK